MDPAPVQLDVYRTAIPMRRFEHAAARRDAAEAIVVRLELSDGSVGWGETLPREYVTGEAFATVADDIERLLWPAAIDGDPQGKDLPAADGGRAIAAARCAVELALDGAWQCHRQRSPKAARQRPPFPPVRFSGVLGSSDPARTARQLRRMRWYGLRDFKLKLGLGDDLDAENLRLVHRRIGKALRKGKCTLRADVNGAWPADETPQRAADLRAFGVCVVEQPVFAPAEALIELARRCPLPLMADESLIAQADADAFARAADAGVRLWLNLRLSKNGGLWPTLAIVETAAQAQLPFVVGCMVGESSILSAAQRRLLWLCPLPKFAEGNYGRFLLRDDLVARPLRFGWGGRIRRPERGLWPVVDPQRLERYGRLVKALRA